MFSLIGGNWLLSVWFLVPLPSKKGWNEIFGFKNSGQKWTTNFVQNKETTNVAYLIYFTEHWYLVCVSPKSQLFWGLFFSFSRFELDLLFTYSAKCVSRCLSIDIFFAMITLHCRFATRRDVFKFNHQFPYLTFQFLFGAHRSEVLYQRETEQMRSKDH